MKIRNEFIVSMGFLLACTTQFFASSTPLVITPTTTTSVSPLTSSATTISVKPEVLNKSVADKIAADKPASDKSAADKAVADKAASDKPVVVDKAAKEKADKEAADKAVKDKEAADKAAKEKADKEAADKAEKEKADKETADKKAATDKEKADKEAADKKSASDKEVADKVAADKEKADKEVPTIDVKAQQILISVYIQNNFTKDTKLNQIELLTSNKSEPLIKSNLNIPIPASKNLYSKGSVTAFDLTTDRNRLEEFNGILSITIDGKKLAFNNAKIGFSLSDPIKITQKDGAWILDQTVKK